MFEVLLNEEMSKEKLKNNQGVALSLATTTNKFKD